VYSAEVPGFSGKVKENLSTQDFIQTGEMRIIWK
jgi:hypothetical protein